MKVVVFMCRFSILVLVLCCSSCDFSAEQTKNEIVTTFSDKGPKEDTKKIIPYNVLERMKAREEITLITSAIDTLPVAEELEYKSRDVTLFVPTNETFEKYDATLSATEILNNATVSKKITTIYLTKKIREYDGAFILKTDSGKTLTAFKEGTDLFIKDSQGNVASITKSDISATNGLIHIVEGVLYP